MNKKKKNKTTKLKKYSAGSYKARNHTHKTNNKKIKAIQLNKI